MYLIGSLTAKHKATYSLVFSDMYQTTAKHCWALTTQLQHIIQYKFFDPKKYILKQNIVVFSHLFYLPKHLSADAAMYKLTNLNMFYN